MAHPVRAAALIALPALCISAAGAQEDRRARLSAEVAFTTPLVEDGNGTTVRYAPAPAVGGGFAWTLSPGLSMVLGARAARAGVRVEDQGGERDAGSGWAVDATAALERTLGCADPEGTGCLALRAGVGALWLGGPDDVTPFRAAGGARLQGEFGAAMRIAQGLPLHLTAAAQAFRLGGETAGDPVRESGTVLRVLVGVRHGR